MTRNYKLGSTENRACIPKQFAFNGADLKFHASFCWKMMQGHHLKTGLSVWWHHAKSIGASGIVTRTSAVWAKNKQVIRSADETQPLTALQIGFHALLVWHIDCDELLTQCASRHNLHCLPHLLDLPSQSPSQVQWTRKSIWCTTVLTGLITLSVKQCNHLMNKKQNLLKVQMS